MKILSDFVQWFEKSEVDGADLANNSRYGFESRNLPESFKHIHRLLATTTPSLPVAALRPISMRAVSARPAKMNPH